MVLYKSAIVSNSNSKIIAQQRLSANIYYVIMSCWVILLFIIIANNRQIYYYKKAIKIKGKKHLTLLELINSHGVSGNLPNEQHYSLTKGMINTFFYAPKLIFQNLGTNVGSKSFHITRYLMLLYYVVEILFITLIILQLIKVFVLVILPIFIIIQMIFNILSFLLVIWFVCGLYNDHQIFSTQDNKYINNIKFFPMSIFRCAQLVNEP